MKDEAYDFDRHFRGEYDYRSYAEPVANNDPVSPATARRLRAVAYVSCWLLVISLFAFLTSLSAWGGITLWLKLL